MNYRIEVYDTAGRRIAQYTDVPLIEVVRSAPDEPDRIRGLLPAHHRDLGPGYRIRAYVEDALVCDAEVTDTAPEWSDARKLILDRYVNFHDIVAFEAESPAHNGNTSISRAYTNETVRDIVMDLINSAPGAIHYYVAHAAYPDGAEREYAKFLARKSDDTELEVGGIDEGQWVGAPRIDFSGAFAKDGDTIAGIVVDGESWPDLRLMLIDEEETSRNSHAISRHPEVADWTDPQYDASGYKRKADAAKEFLQDLIDTHGIDYIELNPHRDNTGAFDDRIDAFGRYLGLVYGGGQCYNAALVEQGHADVFLYDDGNSLVPELALKDFFSYAAPHEDSIESADAVLASYDATAGVFEALTAMAYAADGYVWSIDPQLGVTFRKPLRPDRVVAFDPIEHGVVFGRSSRDLANVIYVTANPVTSGLAKTYARSESADYFGPRVRHFDYFALSLEEDADRLLEALLDDLAYPEPAGAITFFHGNADLRVGDIVELRGERIARLDRELPGEYAARFIGRRVARIRQLTHRFTGRQVVTTVRFTSPLRSVDNPLSYILRSQPVASTLYHFRLDAPAVGLDSQYYLA